MNRTDRDCLKVIGLFILIHLFFITMVSSHPPRENARRASCQSNLKQIVLAFHQYSQEYNGRFPSVKSGGAYFGWADAIRYYTKTNQIFHCPLPASKQFLSKPHLFSSIIPKQLGYSSYYMNSRLNQINVNSLNYTATIILLCDGHYASKDSNARYSKSTLPPAWVSDLNSPANRHLEGANYAFVDGHVKWLKPNRIKEVTPDQNSPTFFIQLK